MGITLFCKIEERVQPFFNLINKLNNYIYPFLASLILTYEKLAFENVNLPPALREYQVRNCTVHGILVFKKNLIVNKK